MGLVYIKGNKGRICSVKIAPSTGLLESVIRDESRVEPFCHTGQLHHQTQENMERVSVRHMQCQTHMLLVIELASITSQEGDLYSITIYLTTICWHGCLV